MKIIVDELPNNGRECMFAIHEYHWNPSNKSSLKPLCKVRMKNAYDWDHMTFRSTDNLCNCLLDLKGECPYLKTL